MRRGVPAGTAGACVPIIAKAPAVVRVLWYVQPVRKNPEDDNPLAGACFELLRADGETLTLVDPFDDGWMRDVGEAQDLFDTACQIRDQLDDFATEILDIIRKNTPAQLDLFDHA